MEKEVNIEDVLKNLRERIGALALENAILQAQLNQARTMTLLSELVPVVRTIDDSMDETERWASYWRTNDTNRMGTARARNHRYRERSSGTGIRWLVKHYLE
jgi:hypothetical protein